MFALYAAGIDSVDKLCIQAQPCAARAAAGPGEPLARPWRDAQSQVRGNTTKFSAQSALLCRKPAGIVEVFTDGLF